MTNLKCLAHNCGHNKDNYCCKDSILVEGKNAQTPAATSCASFVLKEGKGCFEGECPSCSTNIECSAETCVFNEDKLCRATEIEVAGVEAISSDKTECESFKKG